MLNIRSLTCGYDEKMILHEINLTLMPGQILAVIGPNGAGKSTMVKAISGVIPIEHGSIQWDDIELSHLKIDERAKLVSVVPQARNLPSAFTGYEVVSLGRTPYLNWLGQLSTNDEAIINEVMTQTGTLEFANQPVGELSGENSSVCFWHAPWRSKLRCCYWMNRPPTWICFFKYSSSIYYVS